MRSLSRTSGPSSARLRPAGLQAACSPSAAFSSSLEIVIVLASFPKHGPGQPYTEDLTLSSHAGACRLKASLAENRARLTDTPNVRLPAGPPSSGSDFCKGRRSSPTTRDMTRRQGTTCVSRTFIRSAGTVQRRPRPPTAAQLPRPQHRAHRQRQRAPRHPRVLMRLVERGEEHGRLLGGKRRLPHDRRVGAKRLAQAFGRIDRNPVGDAREPEYP